MARISDNRCFLFFVWLRGSDTCSKYGTGDNMYMRFLHGKKLKQSIKHAKK
jgi:hypothetical protein